MLIIFPNGSLRDVMYLYVSGNPTHRYLLIVVIKNVYIPSFPYGLSTATSNMGGGEDVFIETDECCYHLLI